MHRVATRDELFGRDPLLASADHDRSTMGVVGANVDAIIAAKLLKTNPEIGLDIFDEMTEMNVAVGIRQRAGYDNFPIFRHNTPIDWILYHNQGQNCRGKCGLLRLLDTVDQCVIHQKARPTMIVKHLIYSPENQHLRKGEVSRLCGCER